jgi:hypothetical protein
MLGGIETMRPVDIFAIAVAVVIALLSLIIEPWSGPWWAALLTACFIALWTLLHMLLGRSAQRTVKLTAILFLAIGTPSLGGWYWRNYPASAHVMQAYFPSPLVTPKPPAAAVPAPTPPRKTSTSRLKAYYDCKNKEGELDKAAIERNSAHVKSFIEPYAEAYEFKPPTITAVPGGDKVELIPLKNPPVDVPTKRIYQIVRVGKELTGIYTAEYLITAYGQVPLVPNSAAETTIRK